ncbi:related to YND1 - apyrase (NDPase/NTPase) [Pseudozyma flocculosa]|uniref:Related to YND1 - apyrase (NDPase/NTPase) n=2 Tax=Pseudozyma flocculosa TaxID=84751 RepID=A0A5C3F8P0_9BASI|nr:related to YND1 - apyrase (NDPase/NTPase) [Pseudozyma flocculosa]
MRSRSAYTEPRDSGSRTGGAKAHYSPDAGSAQLDAPAEWLQARKYAVLVDAGSSGSRMQVYSWKDPKLDRALKESRGQDIKTLPKVEKGTWEGSGMDWTVKVEPGISSFGDHPSDLAAYLRPLMEHAEKVVPPSAWSDTPIYIMATAGMRLLPDSQREAVLSETCRYVREHTSFRIDGGCSSHVSVISGEEEGLLGWISVNYLMDGFHIRPKQNLTEGEADLVEGKSTFGFLDMGGASTQIAFEPSKAALQAEEGQSSAQEELTPVSLRMLDGTEVSHQVFVTTFLGYGTNQARQRYVKQLRETGKPLALDTAPATSTSTSTSTSASSSAVAAVGAPRPYADPCLPEGLQLTAAGHDHTDVSLVGTGSFTECLEATHPLLDKEATCTNPPCLFHGVHVPKIDFSVNHFIGVSEYWFSSNDVFNQGGVYDFVSFQKAAVDFCGKPWSELKSHLDAGDLFGPQVELNRLQLQCFKAAWMVTVLHEGIGLPRIVDSKGQGDGKDHTDEAQDKADQKNLFQSVNDVDGFSVSWTLGKAVVEASRDIPPAPKLLPSPLDGLPLQSGGSGGAVGLGGWKPFGANWPTTGEGSAFPPALQAGQRAFGPAAVLVAVAAFLVLALTCLCTRGRSPRATRRRAAIKELLPPPLGSLGGVCAAKRGARGDYALASMEEASEVKGPAFGSKWFSRGKRGESLLSSPELESEQSYSSEGSSEESVGGGRSRNHRRRKSNTGFLRTLMLPARRLFYGAAALLPASVSSRAMRASGRSSDRLAAHARRATASSGRIPVRRGATSPTLVKVSRPGSPGLVGITSGSTISRPASRTSSRAPTPTLGLRSGAPGAHARPVGPFSAGGMAGMHGSSSRPGYFTASLTRANSQTDLGQAHENLLAPNSATATTSAMLSRSPSRVGSPAPHLSPMSEVRP